LLFIYPGYRDGVGIGEGLHGMSATGQTIESLRCLEDFDGTPWKINAWNLQITHEKQGK